MIAELGYICVLLAMVLSGLMALMPLLLSFFKNLHFIPSSCLTVLKRLSYLHCLSLLLSFITLLYSFYSDDFSLVFVAEHSNALMPWYYKISAAWGGHEGSLLLWAVILSLWTVGVTVSMSSISSQSQSNSINETKVLPDELQVFVLAALGAVQIGILLLIVISSSPFDHLAYLPVDGAELNPLLQDIGLIMHPPILYMGYVGMAVPFAFAVAVLLLGRMERRWIAWLRRFVLVAWAFLTLGIAMGSWWAYYELGWGGWWFWDPVENASLLPWLACTALIHSLSVTQKRGHFQAWTVLLSIVTFAMSLLGTFLVRSGVINSVHAFASDPERGVLVLMVLAVLIGGALLLYSVRGWRLLTTHTQGKYQLKSKESLIAINNIILSVAVVVVLLGTLYPIIADAFGLGQVSVGAPYFNAMFVPLAWMLLFGLAYAPLLRWQHDSRPFLGISLVIFMTAFVISLSLVFVFFQQWRSLLSMLVTLVLVAWVLGFILKDIYDKSRKSSSFWSGMVKIPLNYWSMHLAHVGVLVLCLGISLTSTLSVEKDVALRLHESVNIQQTHLTTNKNLYSLKLVESASMQVDNYRSDYAVFLLSKNDQIIAKLRPEKRKYLSQRQKMTEVAVSATIWRDIYVALGEPLKDGKHGWIVRVHYKPFIRWVWAGAVLMALAGCLALLSKRR